MKEVPTRFRSDETVAFTPYGSSSSIESRAVVHALDPDLYARPVVTSRPIPGARAPVVQTDDNASSASGGSVPMTPYIEGSVGDGYHLAIPLVARVWRQSDEYVASQDQLRVHAFGTSAAEALQELKGVLLDHFIDLSSHRGRLGNRLQEDLDLLELLLRRDADV